MVGDGPARGAVETALAPLPAERLRFLGERPPEAVPGILATAAVLAWPGRGEAYGLAYLEAQAAGLPVVAERVAGVPEVVRDGVTGLLAPAGDAAAFAAAVASLIGDPARCRAMGAAARRVVLAEHSLEAAALRLDAILARGGGSMRPHPTWQPLADALDRLADAGRSADFWLRDDDAVAPTAALDRLLAMTASHGVPLTLAVIPSGSGAPLAERLAGLRDIEVAVHGWSHANHAPPHEKKQELGPHRPSAVVLGELARGLRHLGDLHGGMLLPMLVPPWNRIDAGLVGALPDLGFEALSTFGPARPAPLAVLNATVDIVDWHGTRSCREPAALVAELVGQLERAAPAPVGLLGHHLVHDEACWRFLEDAFAATAGHPAARWRSARVLCRDR